MVKLLCIRQVKEEADVNIKDREEGQTVLHIASQEGYFKIVKLLVKTGASIEIKNNKSSARSF